jgi:hypothetical protein
MDVASWRSVWMWLLGGGFAALSLAIVVAMALLSLHLPTPMSLMKALDMCFLLGILLCD